MWRIRSLTRLDNRKKPQYWSDEVGWTWKDFGRLYTEEQKATTSLPPESEWERVEE